MPPDSGRESPLAPGSKLDGYELLWPVGEGGMASVWVARLTRKHGFEKLVAIKTILPKFAEDEAFQKMFLDEARIASRIDHTNVAHIHDLGEKDDILYLVMEYVDGDALTRLRKIANRKNIPFPVGVALRIMSDVCAGLHAAHELKGVDGKPLGVVHRDVSPQNILVTTDGVSKLIDFGVAKAAGRLTAETHTGYVKGKVQYMAPEQALGRNVDRRADVWAVGAVIYHLVANRPPFEADNQLALLNLLQKGRPPAPLPPSVPAPVADLIKKALTHHAAQRFQTAAEMRGAIEKTGLAATQEEVAAFANEHLGEMAERRRASIAGAIQSLEQAAAPPLPVAPPPLPIDLSGSTQRIDPSQLPHFDPRVAHNVPLGRPPPASDMRIGPPTPHSFPVGPPSVPMPVPARRTEPLAAPLTQLVPGVTAANAPSAPASNMPSSAATPPAFLVPPGATEPLPPPEAILDGLNENTNGGGSLGLASISASINTRRPRNVPLIAAGIGGVVLLVATLVLAVSVSRGGSNANKLDPQFSPLPSGAPASATPTPTRTEAPPPPPAEELPAPSETAPAPAPEPAPAPAPAPAPTTHPATAPAPVPFKPATTGSARKKPRVDDGF